MKNPTKIIITVLIATFNWATGYTAARAGGPGFPKGTIYFIPETDVRFIPDIIGDKDVYGSEIFTTWGRVEPEEGVYDWHYIDSLIEVHRAVGKQVAIRVTSTSFSINDTPEYIYSKYGIRRIAPGYWENFEQGDKGYILHGEVIAGDPIAGKYSLRQRSAERVKILESGPLQRFDCSTGITNPTHNPDLAPRRRPRSAGFTFQFDYRAVADTRFSVVAYSVSRPSKKIVRDWVAPAGEEGMKTFNFVPPRNDYKLELWLEEGDIVIDNVNTYDRVTGYGTGTLSFPNFFDPRFLERYELFVKALAEKYGDDPAVGAICAGGYGRWEEMTLSDEEDWVLEDQWPTFGFTNDKYADHIKACIDLYVRYFPDKYVYTGAVGWNTDSYRDQGYIDWKVGTYAASLGVGIKYNGWQHLCSEWQSDGTGFFYAGNRYRHDPRVWVMFEESHQVSGYPFMGHPLSLFNRAIIANIDYGWVYSYDLKDSYFKKYRHYFNEQAGSALSTKLYNDFGRYDYYSTRMKEWFVHKNVWKGLYQLDDINDTEYNYTVIDGVKAVETGGQHDSIRISIDDRLRYNGMYGAVLSIDYLDRGADRFTVSALFCDGMKEIASVIKTDSGQWRTLNIRDTGWTGREKNNGSDDPVEIIIDDCGDGIETIRMMELNQVPAGEWEEVTIAENGLHPSARNGLEEKQVFEVGSPEGCGVSGISVNVSCAATGRADIRARVYARVQGEDIPVVARHYYLPVGKDWFYLPLATVPDAESYTVEVDCPEGEAWLNLAHDSATPAYRLHAFVGKHTSGIASADGSFTALKPFYSLRTAGDAEGDLILKRVVASGNYPGDVTVRAYGTGTVHVEPQVAGHYTLEDSEGNPVPAAPVYLTRKVEPKEPVRYVVGEPIRYFKWGRDIMPAGGWKNEVAGDGFFYGEVAGEYPYVETAGMKAVTADMGDHLHFVIKNGTSSPLAKLYWKGPDGDFDESDSVLIPIVPDDNRYREYCFPVGLEEGWDGSISALRLVPVTGHTDAGEVFIHTIGLRNGIAAANTFGEKLEVDEPENMLSVRAARQ